MIRTVSILVAGLAVAAAAPALPMPPIPPAHMPGELAPVPNANIRPPVAAASTAPVFSLEQYRRSDVNVSQGFTPGSRFMGPEDRRLLASPGLSVRVPLGSADGRQ